MPFFADPSPSSTSVLALFVRDGQLCVAPWLGVPSRDAQTQAAQGLRLVVEHLSVHAGWDIETCRAYLVNRINSVDEEFVFRIAVVPVGTGDMAQSVPFLLAVYRGEQNVTTTDRLSGWASALGVVVPGPEEMEMAGIQEFDMIEYPGSFRIDFRRSIMTMNEYRSGAFSLQRTRVRPPPISFWFDQPVYQFEGNMLIQYDRFTRRRQELGQFHSAPGFIPRIAVWTGPPEILPALSTLRVSLLHQGVQLRDCDDPAVNIDQVVMQWCPFGFAPRGMLLFKNLPITWTPIGSVKSTPVTISLNEDPDEDNEELVDSPADDSDMIELGFVWGIDGWTRHREVSPPLEDESQLDLVPRLGADPDVKNQRRALPTIDEWTEIDEDEAGLSRLSSGQTGPIELPNFDDLEERLRRFDASWGMDTRLGCDRTCFGSFSDSGSSDGYHTFDDDPAGADDDRWEGTLMLTTPNLPVDNREIGRDLPVIDFDETREEYEAGDPVFDYPEDPMETPVPRILPIPIAPPPVSGLFQFVSNDEVFDLWQVVGVNPDLVLQVLSQTLTIGVAPGTPVAQVQRAPAIAGSVSGDLFRSRWVEGVVGPVSGNWGSRQRYTQELCKMFSSPVVIQTVGVPENHRLAVRSAVAIQKSTPCGVDPDREQCYFVESGCQYRVDRCADPASQGWCINGVTRFRPGPV